MASVSAQKTGGLLDCSLLKKTISARGSVGMVSQHQMNMLMYPEMEGCKNLYINQYERS